MPALTAKPSLGVAVSGGGYRATTTGLGWLRSLQRQGLLPKARYLSSNSGGSWLNGAMSYTQVPLSVFFGPGPAPEEMEWERVRNGSFLPDGSYGRAIEKATIVGDAISSVVVDTVFTPDSVAQVKGWSDTVGEAFLDPFGVGPHGSSMTALGAGVVVEGGEAEAAGAAGAGNATKAAAATSTKAVPAATTNTTKATTKATTTTAAGRRLLLQQDPTTVTTPTIPTDRPISPFSRLLAAVQSAPPPSPLLGVAGPVAERVSAQAPAIPFLAAAATPDRPFPILVGSILAPNTTHPYRPTEFTPLYVATPGQDPPPVEDELTGKGGKPDPQAASGGTYPPLGGFAVEPLALNSYPPPAEVKPEASTTGRATTKARSRFVTPLVTAVGVSSSFVAQGLRPSGDAAEDITGTETLYYWAPSRDGKVFEGRDWGFADGGGVDNTAIIPLLRRGVKRIVAGTATSTAADGQTNATAWAASQWDVSGLFGAVKETPAMKQGKVNGMKVRDFNAFMQVFPRSGYEPLYEAVSGAVAEGKPATYRLKTTVLPNKWQGVEGGYEVDLLWFFNMPCAEFEEALPQETRDALGSARRDDQTNKQQQRGGGAPDLKTFPMISTFNADYSPALTTLLAGQSEWQAEQAASQVAEMMAEAEAEQMVESGESAAAGASGGGGSSKAPAATSSSKAPAAAAAAAPAAAGKTAAAPAAGTAATANTTTTTTTTTKA
jgi:hypothetical protein